MDLYLILLPQMLMVWFIHCNFSKQIETIEGVYLYKDFVTNPHWPHTHLRYI